MTKRHVILAVLITAALALIAATQNWFRADLDQTQLAVSQLEVSGQEANPGLVPLAIAAIASGITLTIVGKVFRVILGAIITLIGVGIVWLSMGFLGDPLKSANTRLSELTGLTGGVQLQYVTAHETTLWVWIAAAAGALLAFAGIAAVLRGGTWQAAGRKYDTHAHSGARSDSGRGGAGDNEHSAGTAAQASDHPDAERDRISDWDMLSGGDDPSEEQGEQ